jgi:hypothetical protein
MREMTGGCLCGQVRYSANADPAFVGVCHCEHCQKQTGTAFSVLVGIPKSAISTHGQLKTFHDKGDSGQTVERSWTVLKTWSIGSISDSMGLDGFGAKACGGSRGFSISIIG